MISKPFDWAYGITAEFICLGPGGTQFFDLSGEAICLGHRGPGAIEISQIPMGFTGPNQTSQRRGGNVCGLQEWKHLNGRGATGNISVSDRW